MFCSLTVFQTPQRVGSAASEVRIDCRQETSSRSAVVPRRDWASQRRADHEHGRTHRRQILVRNLSADVYVFRIRHSSQLLAWYCENGWLSLVSGIQQCMYVSVRRTASHWLTSGFKTKKASVMISSPSESLNILVSRNIWFITKFERGHPERGRFLRLGWVQTGDFCDCCIANWYLSVPSLHDVIFSLFQWVN